MMGDLLIVHTKMFSIFFFFSFISYGRSFLTKDHECNYFLYDHLDFLDHALKLFCVCVDIPSAKNVTRFHTIPVKL